MWTGKLKWYSDLLRPGTVQRSNPGRGEIFNTCPDWPWGPPSLLYNGYRVFPEVKVAGTAHPNPAPKLKKE